MTAAMFLDRLQQEVVSRIGWLLKMLAEERVVLCEGGDGRGEGGGGLGHGGDGLGEGGVGRGDGGGGLGEGGFELDLRGGQLSGSGGVVLLGASGSAAGPDTPVSCSASAHPPRHTQNLAIAGSSSACDSRKW